MMCGVPNIQSKTSVTGLLNWAVRCVSETEMVMNSVERVLYTSQQTPQEPPHHVSRWVRLVFVVEG